MILMADPIDKEARGRAVRSVRESYEKRLGRKFYQRDAAKLLKINENTYRSYEKGQAEIPIEHARVLAGSFGVSVEEFYLQEKSPKPVDKSGTDVYYNNSTNIEDSASALREIGMIVARGDTVTVTARRVSLQGSWSAKSSENVNKIVSALLGAASYFIVAKDFPNITDGMLLAFRPTDYPILDKYLLFQSKSNPDLHLIGWLEPDSPTTIQSGSAQESLSDWKLLGWANAVAYGAGDSFGNTIILQEGFGPRTRISVG